MLTSKQNLVRDQIIEGTGAEVDLEVEVSSSQTGLKIWFADIGKSQSPIVGLFPTGLHRYEARLWFGNFAAPTIAQLQRAGAEEIQLARALIRSVTSVAKVTLNAGQTLENWTVRDGNFTITAEKRDIENRYDDDTLISTCQELVVPILAAMAELYGYDLIDESIEPSGDLELEGALTLATIRRRERSPRNRLLCLRLHKEICSVCGLDPRRVYGDAGGIIEVHHLQPLSLQDGPRPYDPATDLIPLCPSCHRAIHTRRPVPWTPNDLKLLRHSL